MKFERSVAVKNTTWQCSTPNSFSFSGFFTKQANLTLNRGLSSFFSRSSSLIFPIFEVKIPVKSVYPVMLRYAKTVMFYDFSMDT